MPAEYLHKPHILLQNIPDVLDPSQQVGAQGLKGELSLHLLARSAHMAMTGDRLIVDRNTPPDFLSYISSLTGQRPNVVRASIGIPVFTRDILGAIDTSTNQGHVLNPYVQGAGIGAFSEQTGIPNAFTPFETLNEGVGDRANDKAYFRQVAPEIGMPVIPDQQIIDSRDTNSLKQAIKDTIKKYNGAFIQANKSGGGVGNIDVQIINGEVRSKLGSTTDEVVTGLEEWFVDMQEAGSDKIIVAPYVDMVASHTVSGFIPPNGETPFSYGISSQVLDPTSHDYIGYEWPAVDPVAAQYGLEMKTAAMRWFGHLQSLGYVGPSDVDYIVGRNPQLGEVLGASESNTRWDSFRFSQQYAAQLQGWNLRDMNGIDPANTPSIRAFDHFPTTAGSTLEILARLSDANIPLFGLPSTAWGKDQTSGIIVMVPPRKSHGHYETGIAAIADDLQAARAVFERTESLIGA